MASNSSTVSNGGEGEEQPIQGQVDVMPMDLSQHESTQHANEDAEGKEQTVQGQLYELDEMPLDLSSKEKVESREESSSDESCYFKMSEVLTGKLKKAVEPLRRSKNGSLEILKPGGAALRKSFKIYKETGCALTYYPDQHLFIQFRNPE